MVGFYLRDENQRGFAYGGPSIGWSQFGVPAGTVPNPGWISAITSPVADGDRVYAVWVDSNLLQNSADRGATWAASAIGGLPSFPAPSIFSLFARAGEVHLLEDRANDSMDGIWRSANDGASWSRIIAFQEQALGVSGSGFMDTGDTKIWYAVKTAQTNSTGASTWSFRRANRDGSDIEMLGGWSYPGPIMASHHIVRAFGDGFALMTTHRGNSILRVDPSGVTYVRPSSLARPWDAMPLSATTWLAVGTSLTASNVLVYRTTDAGATWTLVTTIPSLQGFARRGAPDSYWMVDAAVEDPNTVYMLGNADSNVQQIVWESTDGGISWAQLLNAAEPQDEWGDWTVYGPGGIFARGVPLVVTAAPSRLATIVG